jgi:hypothetical protein
MMVQEEKLDDHHHCRNIKQAVFVNDVICCGRDMRGWRASDGEDSTGQLTLQKSIFYVCGIL